MNLLPAALLLTLATSALAQKSIDQLVEFRDTLKPGTREAARQEFRAIPWKDAERALIKSHLEYVHGRAPSLLTRAALDDTIRLYRTDLKNFARGGRQFIAIDARTFAPKSKDWGRRILIHELVQSANHFRTISNSKGFRTPIEPRLRKAHAILKGHGLTPIEAAQLPFDERRKKIDMQIRQETSLPSLQATLNLSACLAEMASLWIDGKFKYTPPADVLPSLEKMARKAPAEIDALTLLLQGEASFSRKQFDKALLELEAAVATMPELYQAIALRGHTQERLGNLTAAAADLQKAASMISPYEHGYQYYRSEAERLAKAAK